MVGRPREGWMLYSVMVCLFVAATVGTGWAEQAGNPLLAATTSLQQAPGANQPGGNMEGKETRFGIGSSVLTEVVTSSGATGSTNSAPDSYTPIGGLIPLVNMLLGEIVFGGLGTGLYSLILVVLLALFITGLMVGRTPEYLGKNLSARGGHSRAICDLRQQSSLDRDFDRAAGVPDPDDYWRACVGNRHRWYGSRHPLQRPGHVGPRGRSSGRHRRAAARQNGHHYVR